MVDRVRPVGDLRPLLLPPWADSAASAVPPFQLPLPSMSSESSCFSVLGTGPVAAKSCTVAGSGSAYLCTGDGQGRRTARPPSPPPVFEVLPTRVSDTHLNITSPVRAGQVCRIAGHLFWWARRWCIPLLFGIVRLAWRPSSLPPLFRQEGPGTAGACLGWLSLPPGGGGTLPVPHSWHSAAFVSQMKQKHCADNGR